MRSNGDGWGTQPAETITGRQKDSLNGNQGQGRGGGDGKNTDGGMSDITAYVGIAWTRLAQIADGFFMRGCIVLDFSLVKFPDHATCVNIYTVRTCEV